MYYGVLWYNPTFLSPDISHYFPKYFRLSNASKNDISGALRDLVPCAQFKKREKHPWRIVTFSSLQLY